MSLQHILKRDRPLFPVANPTQNLLGKINILQILKMLENCFADVKAFGAPGAASQLVKPPFNRLGQSNG